MIRHLPFLALSSIVLGCTPSPTETGVDTGLVDSDTDTGRIDTDTDTDAVDTDTGDTDPPRRCQDLDLPTEPVLEPSSCPIAPLSDIPPPMLKWAVSSDGARFVVARVYDTNSDSVLDGYDVPSVIHSAGDVEVVAGASGLFQGQVTDTSDRGRIGVADLDGDGMVELAGSPNGYTPWLYDAVTGTRIARGRLTDNGLNSLAPQFIDIDADGISEVVQGAYITGADGSDLGEYRTSSYPFRATAVDLDRDGIAEIAISDVILDATTLRPACTVRGAGEFAQYVATQLDSDTDLELFLTDVHGDAIVQSDCSLLRSSRVYTGEPAPDGTLRTVRTAQQLAVAGPLVRPRAPFSVVADAEWWLDGRSISGLLAIDSDQSELWRVAGHALMVVLGDLDGDGLSEVVVTQKDGALVLRRGTTGEEIWRLTDAEYYWPKVVDVDNDGHADIVAIRRRNHPDQGPILELVALESSGTPWAPAQSWWHQEGLGPESARADGRVLPPPGIERHPLYGSFRSAFDPTPLQGGGSEPAVRVREVCELECDAGVAHIWVQLGNLADTELDLPMDLVVQGTVGGEVTTLLTVPVEGALQAATWRAGQDLTVPVTAPVEDLTVELVPRGWVPLSVCSATGMVARWEGAVCP